MREAILSGWRYFSLGFVATFAIYALVRWDVDKVVQGAIIAAVVGVVLVIVVFVLKRRRDRTTTVGG